MESLLKTASVRVSSIQIMQVRVQNKGKSVWKSRYEGDVSGTWRIQCCPRISRSTCVIILRSATQAHRELRYFHARNFRVQPQAIMGSSIVE